MRDPKRIEKYCDELKLIWEKVPDWRFGQLMMNTLGEVQNKVGNDLFFVEDAKFFAAFAEVMNDMTGGNK